METGCQQPRQMLEALRGGAERSWMRCSRFSASSISFFGDGSACAAVAATSAIATYLSMAYPFIPLCRKDARSGEFSGGIVNFTKTACGQPEEAGMPAAALIPGDRAGRNLNSKDAGSVLPALDCNTRLQAEAAACFGKAIVRRDRVPCG